MKKIQTMKFFLITALVFDGLFDLTSQTPMRGHVKYAKENEFPFVVSIQRNDKIAKSNPAITHYCTGSLITKKHVLTAEHCFENEQANNTFVLYGSVDLKSGKRYDVESWISFETWLYEKYKRTTYLHHDIAILTLKRKINDPKLKPIIPLIFPTPDLYGSSAIAAGWGRTENGNQSQILRIARLKIISNDECIKRMDEMTDYENFLLSRYFCSRSDPWALLDCGDSGGPLVRGSSLVGINVGSCPVNEDVSHLSKDVLDKKQMNFHLGLHYYREFIRSVTIGY